MTPQEIRVLHDLRKVKRKGLTFDHYRTGFRLGAVIHRLRNKGFEILTQDEANTWNSGMHARYILIGEPK